MVTYTTVGDLIEELQRYDSGAPVQLFERGWGDAQITVGYESTQGVVSINDEREGRCAECGEFEDEGE